MPSKIRENSPERRRERKEASKHDKDKDRADRKDRHKSSSHRKSSTKDKTPSRTSISPADPKRRSSMPGVIKEESNALKSDSKSSLPYPTFSKEHSKESVGPRRPPQLNIFTPPATDLNASKDKLTPSKSAPAPNAPPSPPLTDQNAGRWKSGGGKPVSVETIREEDLKDERDSKVKIRLQPKSSNSNGHLRSNSELGTKPSPVKSPTKLQKPKLQNVSLPQRSISQPNRVKSPIPNKVAAEEAANDSSDGTSIAPEQPSIQRPGSKIPPAAPLSDIQSQVTSIAGQAQSRGPTPLDIFIDQSPRSSATPASHAPPAPPPPPPPPTVTVPRVDYLLQHGGLHQSVPKNFLVAGKPMAVQHAVSPMQPPVIVANLFEPYHQLLDDFNKVMTKSGSLAVTTGYRSVARRLLDRLEAVFARDISNEFCQCCMCEHENQDGADVRGVSWGEILELVAGRRDLPNWPPFSFVASPVGLGISLEMHAPMQKLDIDVPEEYREHYICQSRKTKQTVDKWLNRQNDAPTSPPEEVDDETLTFAILTHLPAEHRQLFKDLLEIVDKPLEPPRRAPSPEKGAAPPPTPTPQLRHRPEDIITAGLAIQRLYRLATVPRDPETAIFLLNNPTLHNALATLAAVSSDEWEILISGRFDGFLRSGAEDMTDAPQSARSSSARLPSRGTTPAHTNGYHSANHSRHNSASYPRTSTPAAQYGAPIAYDEETEIATLAEIEREIYTGMEVLEDAFEALHVKAEAMRNALRERSAGLATAAQRRKGSAAEVEVRMGTPASTNGFGLDGSRWEAETDDGLGDWEAASELAPDDSASNISTSRRRRPKRRNERRTPKLEGVGEDDEDGDDGDISDGTASPRKQ